MKKDDWQQLNICIDDHLAVLLEQTLVQKNTRVVLQDKPHYRKDQFGASDPSIMHGKSTRTFYIHREDLDKANQLIDEFMNDLREETDLITDTDLTDYSQSQHPKEKEEYTNTQKEVEQYVSKGMIIVIILMILFWCMKNL